MEWKHQVLTKVDKQYSRHTATANNIMHIPKRKGNALYNKHIPKRQGNALF